MTGRIVALNEERLKKSLEQIYEIQQSNCLPEDVMPRVIEKLGIDEEKAIDLLKALINLGWVSTGNINTRFLLRPGYILSFPVFVSAAGMDKINNN